MFLCFNKNKNKFRIYIIYYKMLLEICPKIVFTLYTYININF